MDDTVIELRGKALDRHSDRIQGVCYRVALLGGETAPLARLPLVLLFSERTMLTDKGEEIERGNSLGEYMLRFPERYSTEEGNGARSCYSNLARQPCLYVIVTLLWAIY